jgi:predicted RNase H-like HicB family nuclease
MTNIKEAVEAHILALEEEEKKMEESEKYETITYSYEDCV